MNKIFEKFLTQIYRWDKNKVGYHFAFLFASPPYIPIRFGMGQELKITYDPLNYNEEYRLIRETVKKAQVEITVSKQHATKTNFSNMLKNEHPNAIHFSGHGVTAEMIRKKNISFMGKTG